MLLDLHHLPLTATKTVADKARYFVVLKVMFFNGLYTESTSFQSSALPTELPGQGYRL